MQPVRAFFKGMDTRSPGWLLDVKIEPSGHMAVFVADRDGFVEVIPLWAIEVDRNALANASGQAVAL